MGFVNPKRKWGSLIRKENGVCLSEDKMGLVDQKNKAR